MIEFTMDKQRTTTKQPKKKRFDALLKALQEISIEINKTKPLRLEIDLYLDKVQVKKTDFVTVKF